MFMFDPLRFTLRLEEGSKEGGRLEDRKPGTREEAKGQKEGGNNNNTKTSIPSESKPSGTRVRFI